MALTNTRNGGRQPYWGGSLPTVGCSANNVLTCQKLRSPKARTLLIYRMSRRFGFTGTVHDDGHPSSSSA
eukprot:1733518-Amphidinium_carterae.1